MNWIDIKEQLPDIKDGTSDTVLGFLNGNYWTGKIEEDFDDDGIIQYVFNDDIDWRVIPITHWAKLTPPKTK